MGTLQVAADQMQGLVKTTFPFLAQTVRQALGLGQTQVIEGHINLALKAQLAVPSGFAMAHQKNI